MGGGGDPVEEESLAVRVFWLGAVTLVVGLLVLAGLVVGWAVWHA